MTDRCYHVIYPEKWVKCSIFHELCDDHRWPAFGDHTLQPDNVWLVKLAHDWGFRQEVPPLSLRVAHLQRLDGHRNFFFPDGFQSAFVHLAKLTWNSKELRLDIYNALCTLITHWWSVSSSNEHWGQKLCSRALWSEAEQQNLHDKSEWAIIVAKVIDFTLCTPVIVLLERQEVTSWSARRDWHETQRFKPFILIHLKHD